jgi:steroid 3-oxidase
MSISWPAPLTTCAAGGALLAAAAWLLCFRLLPAAVVARTRRRPVKEEKAQLPPGSFGWPVVGETLDFVSCAYSPRPEAFVDKRRLR